MTESSGVSFAPGSIKPAEKLSTFNPAILGIISALLPSFPFNILPPLLDPLVSSLPLQFGFYLRQISLIVKMVSVFHVPGAEENKNVALSVEIKDLIHWGY